jgi:hypothetical protein
MNKKLCALMMGGMLAFTASAEWVNVSSLYLTNYEFDENCVFKVSDSGNKNQNQEAVEGWTKFKTSGDWYSTATAEYGTGVTFASATEGVVPSEGYNGSLGGCLGLTAAWGSIVGYTQEVTLPAGKYAIDAPVYNAASVTSATSLLAWVVGGSTVVQSPVTTLVSKQWYVDHIEFTLDEETTGLIQIGTQAVGGGSGSNAKPFYDYVHLMRDEAVENSCTDKITNPDLENDGINGWTSVGMGAQGNDSFGLKSGNTYAEKWASTAPYAGVGTCGLTQEITLEAGAYRLYASAQNIDQRSVDTRNCYGAYLVAGDATVPVFQARDYYVEFNVEEEGPVTIGFKCENAEGNWVCCDNFRVYRIGNVSNEKIFAQLQAKISSAEDVAEEYAENEYLYVALKDALNSTIESAKELTVDNSSAEIKAAMSALDEASSALAASYKVYRALTNSVIKAENLYNAQHKGAEDFLEAINTAKALYDKNLTEKTDEMTSAIDTLEAAIETYELIDAEDYTEKITNPGFETYDNGVYEGWTNTNFGTATGGEDVRVETRFCEYWRNTPLTDVEASIVQNVEIPLGKFVLTAWIQNRYQSDLDQLNEGLTLVAGDQSTTIHKLGRYYVDFNVVDENPVEIGVKAYHCTGNWVAFDDFHLYKVPALETSDFIANVATDADTTTPVYYNLQGIRVANPTSGLYIKVCGKKATKVYLK